MRACVPQLLGRSPSLCPVILHVHSECNSPRALRLQ
jgi:hypothetical protein